MATPTLLCVHPHPDDEAIACGGLLAASAARGFRTHVVTCTGGEVGENQAGIDLGAEDMATHRRREMADAIAALGVDGHTWLGYRDSGMVGTPENDHPDAFVQADLYEAAARLAVVIRELRPHVVISDDEHGTYGHPDHIAAHRVTQRALVMAADLWWMTDNDPWQVPKRYVHTISQTRMWGLHEALTGLGLPSPFGKEDNVPSSPEELPFGSPQELITATIDVSDVLDVKQNAMRAHRTQIGEDSFFLNFPEELAEHGFAVEEFIRLDSPHEGPVETDLFAGVA